MNSKGPKLLLLNVILTLRGQPSAIKFLLLNANQVQPTLDQLSEMIKTET